MANLFQSVLESFRGVARTPTQRPTTQQEGVGTAFRAFTNSVVNAIRPLGTSIGEAAYYNFGGKKQYEKIQNDLFASSDRLIAKSKTITDPIEKKRLLTLAAETAQLAGQSTFKPSYTNREIIGSGVKTAGLTLGLPHLGLGGIAIPGAIGGAINKYQGGSFSEGFGRGVGETAPYMGLAGQLTTPALARALPFVKGSRPLQAGLNVAEGAGLSASMNQPYSAENLILDAFLGGALRPFGKNVKIKTPSEEKILATPEAKKVLNEWMTETQSQTIARRNAKLSPQEAYGAVKKVVDLEKFKRIFARWIGKRDVAKTTGVQEAAQFKSIPPDAGPDIISHMEGTKPNVSQEVKNASIGLRQRFDQFWREAKTAGLDIGYLKNYVTHYWKQSAQEVEQAYKGAGTKIGSRTVPTYEEGIKLGLTPKYTNPVQILGDYARRLEEMKANLELIQSLKREGLIVPAGKAEAGMTPLIGPGFPKSKTRTAGGETVIGEFYADPKIASTINKVFSPQEVSPIISGAARVSAGIQDVRLAGGVPWTPLNAWTFTQILFKELPSGRVRGPLKALWVSMTNANKYFEENSDVIKTMQKNNIPINTSSTIESQGRDWLQNAIGTDLGEAWHKAINEPTFRKFMPAMEIEFWKDAYRVSANKTTPALAEEIASAATKNFYGIISSDAMAQRGKLGENLKSIFFMAPRYRETTLNFLWNTVKGLNKPLAPENIANTKWLIGAITMYGIYDLINKETTGKHLAENPPGLEDKLLIPVGNYAVGVPWMSSILTVPRALYRGGRALARGDIGGAVGEVGSTSASIAIKPFVDIARNQDYYGREIAPANATPGEKIKANIGYVGRQWMHPYISELTDPRYKDDPVVQRLSRAAEVPLRFYESDKLNARWYFAAEKEILRTLPTEKQNIYKQIYVNAPKPTTTIEKAQLDQAEATILLANPDILEARRKVLLKKSKKTGEPMDPFFLLQPEKQQVILWRDAQAPGSKDADTLTSNNIDWLKDYWTARSAYFEELKASGVFKDKEELPGPKFTVDADIIKLQNEYFKLPGTRQRAAFLREHPELKAYWDKKSQYENELRAGMGLPPIVDSFGQWGPKKIAKVKVGGAFPKIRRARKTTFNKEILKAFKPIKAPKLKVTKIQIPKFQPIKLKT